MPHSSAVSQASVKAGRYDSVSRYWHTVFFSQYIHYSSAVRRNDLADRIIESIQNLFLPDKLEVFPKIDATVA